MLNAIYAASYAPAWQRSSHAPSRRVVAPTGGNVRGWFPSVKAQRMVAFESLLERDALYLFEFSYQVRDIREQPFRLNYACGDRIRRYTPDFALGLHDGRTIIVEVKPETKLTDPDVAHPLSCIEATLRRQGQPFRVLSDLTIRSQPRLANLQLLHPKLRNPLHQTIALNLRQLAASQSRPRTLGELADALGGHHLALTALAHKAVHCDLSEAFTTQSFIVWPGEEECHEFDCL